MTQNSVKLSLHIESMDTGDDHPPGEEGHLYEDAKHMPSVGDEERILNLEMEMAELMIPGDRILNITNLAKELKGLGLEFKSCDVNEEGVGGQNSTPLKVGVGGPGQWEVDANIWLKEFVQKLENVELKSDLEAELKITKKGDFNFSFGDEIRAHQELEKHLLEKNILTHHILDYFDVDLSTQYEPNRMKCTSVQLCCLGRGMPPVTVKEIITNTPNISSKDSHDDTHYQDDRSQGGWMCLNGRSQEHQDDNLDKEMKSTGKDTNIFLTDSGACNQPAWVRSDQVGKVEEQVKAINMKAKKVMEHAGYQKIFFVWYPKVLGANLSYEVRNFKRNQTSIK